MKPNRLVFSAIFLSAALVASVAPAQTWNMNVDWKFAKLNWAIGFSQSA